MRPIHLATLDKTRPVLVLTRPAVRPVLNSVTVAPITTTIRGLSTEVPVGRTNGLDHDSVVSCDNVTTIPGPLWVDSSVISCRLRNQPSAGPSSTRTTSSHNDRQSLRCMMCSPTLPWVGCGNASGTVPMMVKPNDSYRCTAPTFVSTTALKTMPR